MINEFITIGIPFFNAGEYLDDAICSVLAQTHKFWELILIDDGSTDSSLNIAKKYEKNDDRIKVISDGKNRKLPYRLNQIIEHAQYDYIARMDADDMMGNDRLEKQLKVLIENQNIDFVTSGCLTIDKKNILTGCKLNNNYMMSASEILSGLTNILHASLLARKSWYIRNKYNTSSVLAEDYDLWLQAAKKDDLNYYVIQEPLYWYRVEENVTKAKMLKGYNTQIDIINKNYKGVIDTNTKSKIIIKFKLKKAIVYILDTLGSLDLLLNRRSDDYTDNNLKYFNNHLSNIHNHKIY